jgi:hypothetical protein
VLGIVEGGRLVYSLVTLDFAVEEGGRYAALSSTPSVASVQSYVSTNANFITVPTGNVAVSVNSGGKVYTARTSGDRVEVTATYTYSPIVTSAFGMNLNMTLSARSDVRVE